VRHRGAGGTLGLRRCNPADLPSPSPSQYHAIVYLTVLATMVLGVVFLLLRS